MCQPLPHLEAVLLLGMEMDEDPYHRPSGTRIFLDFITGAAGDLAHCGCSCTPFIPSHQSSHSCQILDQGTGI